MHVLKAESSKRVKSFFLMVCTHSELADHIES